MKINEFSKATGLSTRAIRLYEEKGLLKSQRDSGNKYRIYATSQVSIGKKINQFRSLGFSVKDIAGLLKSSPTLEIKDLAADVRAHLIRLKYQIDEIKIKAQDSENLINALENKKILTKKQKQFFEGFSHAVLKKSASNYTNTYLRKKHLGHDEELQMVASAYAHLFLMAAAQGTMKEFSESHKIIAKTLSKIGETRLAQRHLKLSAAYGKM